MVSVVRHLSSSIALKRDLLTVYLTVSPGQRDKKPSNCRYLQVPETNEWE
jgi:hypothetical protein